MLCAKEATLFCPCFAAEGNADCDAWAQTIPAQQRDRCIRPDSESRGKSQDRLRLRSCATECDYWLAGYCVYIIYIFIYHTYIHTTHIYTIIM